MKFFNPILLGVFGCNNQRNTSLDRISDENLNFAKMNLYCEATFEAEDKSVLRQRRKLQIYKSQNFLRKFYNSLGHISNYPITLSYVQLMLDHIYLPPPHIEILNMEINSAWKKNRKNNNKR